MKTRTTFVLAIITVLAFCLAAVQPAIASDEEDVLQVVMNLYNAANESDSDLASTLYCEPEMYSVYNAGKFGAFLNQGQEPLDNWYDLLRNIPKGTISTSLHNPQVTLLGNNVAIVTGYAIRIVNPPLTTEQITAQIRGTVVLQKTNKKWLVVHEHYSELPTE